ncbi:MAG: PilZ domain-containing protein [Candidatus Omnitrophica bacterium]|nr:PilZ domain-containing protein [Candidatus Omnitrophota bacterium]
MRGLLVFLVSLLIFSYIALLLRRKHVVRTADIPAYLDSYWDALKERRRSIRFREKLPVVCTVSERAGLTHHTFTRNISGEGICLQAPEILPEGSFLDLTIEIPSGRPVKVKGEVVWVTEIKEQTGASGRLFDTGIKFTKIRTKDKTVLDNFLSSAIRPQN